MKEIETKRLILRTFKLSDVQDFFEYAQNEKIGLMAGWKPHTTIERSQKVIETFIERKEVWAIELKENQKVIGLIGLHNDKKRDNVNCRMLGYELNEDYWGKGYILEAIHAILHHGFNDLNIEIISVNHYSINTQSASVIKKAGFVYEGTLRQCTLRFDGKVLDNVHYSLTNFEYNQFNKGRTYASN
ncbi:MAG TPA: GNAT family protein [Erysipelotrichaceae bacterium]|nr:GNAT family protein [Erysipelotrichaceae bacterium]